MFDDKKWSKALKDQTEAFLSELLEGNDPERSAERRKTNLGHIIDLAIEEGRQEVLDDPSKFDLMSDDNLREREPQRDESRD